MGGEKHGKWIKKDKEGVVILEIEYKKGEEIKYNGSNIINKEE